MIDAAVAADRQAVDLYQFTSMINRALEDEGKKKLVEVLFLMGYADGKLTEFENNIVWRASELLHVSSQDRVEIRRPHPRDDWRSRVSRVTVITSGPAASARSSPIARRKRGVSSVLVAPFFGRLKTVAEKIAALGAPAR